MRSVSSSSESGGIGEGAKFFVRSFRVAFIISLGSLFLLQLIIKNKPRIKAAKLRINRLIIKPVLVRFGYCKDFAMLAPAVGMAGLIISSSFKNLMKLLKPQLSKAKSRCIKKFLYYFPKGFRGGKYYDWERGYKWEAHQTWKNGLDRAEYKRLMKEGEYIEIANRAVKLESKTNLLFSFEKMALRDAVKEKSAAKSFAEGLFDYVYGNDPLQDRFENFRDILSKLPRKQTRVLTWPLQTVFGFIGDPENHLFLKPRVTKIAAEKYGFDFRYQSKPNWDTYSSLFEFAGEIRQDLAHLEPVDMIDIQSFIWVLGSEEYPD